MANEKDGVNRAEKGEMTTMMRTDKEVGDTLNIDIFTRCSFTHRKYVVRCSVREIAKTKKKFATQNY